MFETQSKNQKRNAQGLQVAIVHATWHKEIINNLLDGAKQEALTYQIQESQIKTFQVSGAYELSQMVEALAKTKQYDAIVPLGCLIKGETLHFELIAQMLASSFDEIGRKHGIAVSFGVLTVDTLDQAKARAGGNLGNKGVEATQAAIELALTMKENQ